MGWFRSGRSWVTWLAYFALACQLFLSFGHVHLSKAGSAWPAMSASQDAGRDADRIPDAPRNNNSDRALEGFCAICANVYLAAALVVPVAPSLLLPASFVQRLRWPASRVADLQFGEALFDARGPPGA